MCQSHAMELHERLQAARKAAGYETAVDAARSLGVSYPTYAGHENGSSGFRANTGAGYARKFGVSFEWLMRGTGNMFKKEDSPLVQETIEMLRAVDPDFQEVVAGFLRSRIAATSPKPSPGSRRPPPSNRK